MLKLLYRFYDNRHHITHTICINLHFNQDYDKDTVVKLKQACYALASKKLMDLDDVDISCYTFLHETVTGSECIIEYSYGNHANTSLIKKYYMFNYNARVRDDDSISLSDPY